MHTGPRTEANSAFARRRCNPDPGSQDSLAHPLEGRCDYSMERPVPLIAPDLNRTSATVVELVRALATERTDHQIAETLNNRWLRTGTGQRFTRLRVKSRLCHFPNYLAHFFPAIWRAEVRLWGRGRVS